jgi:hypothetical protein
MPSRPPRPGTFIVSHTFVPHKTIVEDEDSRPCADCQASELLPPSLCSKGPQNTIHVATAIQHLHDHDLCIHGILDHLKDDHRPPFEADCPQAGTNGVVPYAPVREPLQCERQLASIRSM